MTIPSLKSTTGKVILIVLGLVLVAAVTFWVTSAVKTANYSRKEAQAEAERKEWLVERQALLNKIAASEALTEAAKKVVEAKRKDTLATIEELERVEQSHEQSKEQIEQQIETGNTESIDKLRRDMDDTLCKRGYKTFCPK